MSYKFRPHLAVISLLLLLLSPILVNSQSSTGSTVRGRVVYVDNQKPLKNVRVLMFTQTDDRWTTMTNDRGEFQFDGVPAGKYYVTVEGSGVPSPSGFGMRIPLPIVPVPRAEDYPEVVPKHDAVVVVDGNKPADLEVRIPRGGALSGKVMKPDGSPAANVPVNLISRDDGSGNGTARFTTRTNEKGVFKFVNVTAANYVVGAATEDKTSNFDVRARLRGESQVVTFHPSAIRLADALTVKVDPGRESSGINITLVDRKYVNVSGTLIRSRDGLPVSGARIVLRNTETEALGPLVPGMGQRMATTTADGKWSFGNVSPGEYEVTALSSVGSLPTDMNPRMRQPVGPRGVPPRLGPVDPGPRPQYVITQRLINVFNVDVEDLTLSLSGAGRVRGQVETDNGQPLPNNLTLFFEVLNDGTRPGRPEPVRVDPDGSFVVENVPAGNRNMVAGVVHGSGFYVASTSFGEQDLSTTTLPVAEDAESGPIRVRISSNFALVSGQVLAESNESTEGLVVLLVPAEAAKQRFRLNYTAVQTASDGSFSARVAPGTYLLLARRRDQLPALITPQFMQSLSPRTERIELSAGESKTVQLHVNAR